MLPFLYINDLFFIRFIGDNMFEYNLLSLKIYGFLKILHIDEDRMEFKYKNRILIIKGKSMSIINLLDKSVEVKGIIEGVDIIYLGGKSD